MDKQEHEKPGEDLVSLPPILPELDIVPNDLGPEIKRVFNLCWLGYSTAVDARDNRYSPRQKLELITDFAIECDKTLSWVSKQSKSFEGTIGDQERIDLFRDFEQFCQRLEKLVGGSISNNSAGFSKFYYLYFHSLSPLLQRMRLMSDIDAYIMNKALREGLQKSAKQHQEQIVPEQETKKRSKGSGEGKKKRTKRKVKLTNRQKEIWEMIEEQRKSAKEVAAELGCSESNVSQRYNEAVKKLEILGSRSRPINFNKTQRIPTDKRGQEIITGDN